MFKYLINYFRRAHLSFFENKMLKEQIYLSIELDQYNKEAKEHRECLEKLNTMLKGVCFEKNKKHHQKSYEYFCIQIQITNGKLQLIKNLIEEIQKDV